MKLKNIFIIIFILSMFAGTTSAAVLNVGSGYTYNTDGTADDVQINQAIQSASIGDTVYVHSGTYNITQPIIMKSGVTLKGYKYTNTMLRVEKSALSTFNVPDAAIIECHNLSSVCIHSFEIDGNDGEYKNCGYGWENGINMYAGGSNYTIHDMYFTKINGDAIRVTPYNSNQIVSNATIYNLQIKHSGHDGIRAQQVKNWRISNITVELYINTGVRFVNATNCELSNSTFYANEGSGSSGVIFTGFVSGINIHHCIFHDICSYSPRCGIYGFNGSGTATVTNNIFYNCPDGAISYSNGTQNLTIKQNIFDNNKFAVNASGTSILSNNIISNSTLYAVKGVDSRHCFVTNCNIYGGATAVINATVKCMITENPRYTNYSSHEFIPLSSSAPLYKAMSSWETAGCQVFQPLIHNYSSSSRVKNSTIVFNDMFENELGQWIINSGNLVTSNIYSHNGGYSLAMTSTGDLYKIFNSSEVNSPNRTLVFYWYPKASGRNVTQPIFSLEEGAWEISSDKTIEMFWNNNIIYFNLYRYSDGSRISTTRSSNAKISDNAWHKIEIISNTLLTQINIDDVPVQFNETDNSPILTNVYNWIRFSESINSDIIRDDDGTYEANTTYIQGNTTQYEKDLVLHSDPSTVYNALLSMKLNKDHALKGHICIDINGVRALTLSNYGVIHSNSDSDSSWINCTVNKSLLVKGTNRIVIFGDSQPTYTTIEIDKGHTYNRSKYSIDNGATWNNITGEYMVELTVNYSPDTYYVDDLLLTKENITNTDDLLGRTYDAVNAIPIPSGKDKIYAIYPYMLTRDSTYLLEAEAGADAIQSSYNNGTHSLLYTKEMAILASIDSNRLPLLNTLTNTEWTYCVNHTTNLPINNIRNDGSSDITALSSLGEPPDALSIVNDFAYAYQTTGNPVYLEYTETTLNAIYQYFRVPTYDTLGTAVYACNGTMVNAWSRGADAEASFIETALFMYEITGNQTYLNNAIYQANQYDLYAWDEVKGLYHYRVDNAGYENYIPSLSLALIHLYKYTGNQIYLDRASSNYYNYMTQMRRNGLLVNYRMSDGRYGHEPAMIEYDIPVIAALLYKYTGNQTYLNLSDEYSSILLNYYLVPSPKQSIYSDNFSESTGLTYVRLQQHLTGLLYRHVLPSKEVNISYNYGLDLEGKYRGLVSVPYDISFKRDTVNLDNVSGNGIIRFSTGIKNAHVITKGNSNIKLQTDTLIENFKYKQSYVNSPSTVQFIDLSENATSWSWDFENDRKIDSIQKNPIHVYEQPGIYSVNLTVHNQYGSLSIVRSNYITVSSEPPAGILTKLYWWLKGYFGWSHP